MLELQYRVEDTAQDNLLSDYWGDVEYVQGVYPKLRYQYVVDMPQERPLYWNKSAAAPGVSATQEAAEDGRVLYRFEREARPQGGAGAGHAGLGRGGHHAARLHLQDLGRRWAATTGAWCATSSRPTTSCARRWTSVLKGVDRKDELAVVRAIYDFVVTNTRYVALEFGIHGYKPYRVDRVLARRFGDCKDKASLIHAMLKVAGVDSRLVLLRMRHLGSLATEPASLAAFNHAIVYVPKFDLYLDGTAEFHGAARAAHPRTAWPTCSWSSRTGRAASSPRPRRGRRTTSPTLHHGRGAPARTARAEVKGESSGERARARPSTAAPTSPRPRARRPSSRAGRRPSPA